MLGQIENLSQWYFIKQLNSQDNDSSVHNGFVLWIVSIVSPLLITVSG